MLADLPGECFIRQPEGVPHALRLIGFKDNCESHRPSSGISVVDNSVSVLFHSPVVERSEEGENPLAGLRE